MRARQLQQPSARFGNASGLHPSQRTWPQYGQTCIRSPRSWFAHTFSYFIRPPFRKAKRFGFEGANAGFAGILRESALKTCFPFSVENSTAFYCCPSPLPLRFLGSNPVGNAKKFSLATPFVLMEVRARYTTRLQGHLRFS